MILKNSEWMGRPTEDVADWMEVIKCETKRIAGPELPIVQSSRLSNAAKDRSSALEIVRLIVALRSELYSCDPLTAILHTRSRYLSAEIKHLSVLAVQVTLL